MVTDRRTAARIKEIEKIRDSDINEYWRRGLDAELLKLVRAQQGGSR